MDLVLNGLSLDDSIDDIWSAREIMINLIKVCKKAIDEGFEKKIRTKKEFKYHELVSGYNVYNWINDNQVARIYRQYFLTLATSSPYIKPKVDQELYEKRLLSDFIFDDKEAPGLGTAYLMNSLAISLDTSEKWDASSLELKMEYFEDDNIESEMIQVLHASKENHINELKESLNKMKMMNINAPNDLWSKRIEIFPYLEFCDNTKKQIDILGTNKNLFNQLVKKLFILNEYFSNWDTGPFNKDRLPCKVTPESDGALQKYQKEHTYMCPDGEERLFTWHVRLTPCNNRIYFIPEPDTRKGVIGYVGPKLSTVKYPT